MYIPHIITQSSITVILDTPKSIDSAHPNFGKVKDILTKNQVKSIEDLLDLMEPVREFKSAIENSLFYTDDYGVVCLDIKGHPFKLHHSLGDEVLRVYRAAGDLTALTNFITKLAENPDKEVHEQLYSFIQVCGLALTLDGDFLAYKNIREDFKDIYTGTMDNSPGKVVEMPRFAVEKDPDKTCSAGLHFAAWGYLQHYGEGQKTVIVKINPADVVSIPSDYNNMKGRAWRYLILKEVERPEELKYRPVFDYVESEDDDYEDFSEDSFDWEDDDDFTSDVELDDVELEDDSTTYEYTALNSSQIAYMEELGYTDKEIEDVDKEISYLFGK